MCGVYERTEFCVDTIHGNVSAERVTWFFAERMQLCIDRIYGNVSP